jgi:hypothetical protein
MKNREFGYADIDKGTILVYQDFGGTERRVLVSEAFENVKNERAGFVGEWLNGEFQDGSKEVWGYCEQIIKVEH